MQICGWGIASIVRKVYHALNTSRPTLITFHSLPGMLFVWVHSSY